MRMFEWTSEMVSFMRDACEQSDYYDKAADHIVDALGGEQAVATMHICDVGCGLGYLSLALAKRCKHVTAVDIASRPLTVLRENLLRKRCSNVSVYEGSAFSLPASMQFDAMVFCLFGSVQEALNAASGHTRQIVMLRRNHAARRFSLKEENTHRELMDTDNALLATLPPLSFCRDISLELNQPIRSIEDAKRFFSLYTKRRGTCSVSESDVRSRLVASSNPDYPYMIPAVRDLTVLSLPSESIPCSSCSA